SIAATTPVVTPAVIEPTASPTATASRQQGAAAPTLITRTPTGASPTSTARPALDPALVTEVGQAYEKYWQVRAQALLELDETHLAEAMGGDHLASTAQLINQLRVENRAIKTDVDHDYHVVQVDRKSTRLNSSHT